MMVRPTAVLYLGIALAAPLSVGAAAAETDITPEDCRPHCIDDVATDDACVPLCATETAEACEPYCRIALEETLCVPFCFQADLECEPMCFETAQTDCRPLCLAIDIECEPFCLPAVAPADIEACIPMCSTLALPEEVDCRPVCAASDH